MSGKEFFANRYQKLGWKFEDTTPKQALRINVMSKEENSIIKRLESLGIELEKIPFLEHGYWISKAKFSMGAMAEYLLGYYSIQEAAAQIPATLFTELKDKTVLDACAAPGGKTIQLADLMQNTGVIVALDIHNRRLAALANHLERCSVENTIVYKLDARQASKLRMKFDRILLDVPCSGNFAADKRWFDRRTIEDVKKNAEVQREILMEAVNVLKDHGEIVYSTCSLEPEEDELNMDWAVKELNLKVEKINSYGEKANISILGKKLDDSVANCCRIWPKQTQGFFVCKLKRADDS
jgi:NOL1/NOP2/sun family putative RNA methylase